MSASQILLRTVLGISLPKSEIWESRIVLKLDAVRFET